MAKAEKQQGAGGGRDRVLATARRLFMDRGAANVGINEIIAEAGIARMTLYNHFASKDALIANVYEELAAEQLRALEHVVPGEALERERVLAIFDHFGRDCGRADYRGCPFIHASLQVSNSAEAVHGTVQRYKVALRAFILSILDAERPQRDDLASQILLLLDGAVTESYLKGMDHPMASAKRAAMVLLAASV